MVSFLRCRATLLAILDATHAIRPRACLAYELEQKLFLIELGIFSGNLLRLFNSAFVHPNCTLTLLLYFQRQHYKLFQKGGPSQLTQEKIDLLNEIAFVWEAQRGGRRIKLRALSQRQKSLNKSARPDSSVLPRRSEDLLGHQAVSSDIPVTLQQPTLRDPNNRRIHSETASNVAPSLAASLDSYMEWTQFSLQNPGRQGIPGGLSSLQGSQAVRRTPALHVPTVATAHDALSDAERTFLRSHFALPAPPNSDLLLQQLLVQRLDEGQRTASAIASHLAREQQIQRRVRTIGPMRSTYQLPPTTVAAAATIRQRPELLDSLLTRSTLENQIAGIFVPSRASYSAAQLPMQRNNLDAIGQEHFQPRASSFLPIREGRERSQLIGSSEDSRRRPRE